LKSSIEKPHSKQNFLKIT